jgi:hypothetical protein
VIERLTLLPRIREVPRSNLGPKTAKAWRSFNFIARILKRGSSKTKELAYLSLIRPLTEYGAVCWDPYRQNQMDTLEHVWRRAAKFVRMVGGHGDDRDGNR